MNVHLLLFTIGPVQSFISQARKTQDLYAGSYLISYLCRITAQKLINEYQAKVVFPDLSNSSLPNRFVAKVEADTDMQRVGIELKEYLLNEFKNISSYIINKLGINPSKEIYRQLENFLQVSWVMLPQCGEQYAKIYKELESTMGAVKNIRIFKQLDETGRKCSLNGEYNVLFYRGKKPSYADKQAIKLNNVPLKYLAENEGLCAISLVKRCAEEYFAANSKAYYNKDFPSTAKISLMDSLSKLSQSNIKAYSQLFHNFDDQLFYEENLSEKSFDSETINHAKGLLRIIAEEATNRGLKFTKYYAVVMLDGDSMGKWLSGELSDRDQLEDFHARLTGVLGEYAKQADRIMTEPRGKLVYSGGDDVLALVNINHLYDVLIELRNEFPKFERLTTSNPETESTCSAGICIAHYKTPLREVLNWARKMEQEAKDVDNKNAFAIAVLKHSGEIQKTIYKWQYDDMETIKILKHITYSIRDEVFSKTFVANLGLEFKKLIGPTGHYNQERLVKAEIGRLLERSYMIKTNPENTTTKKEVLDKMTDYLMQIYLNSTLNNYQSFLNISAFMAREVNSN